MKRYKISLLVVLIFTSISCQSKSKTVTEAKLPEQNLQKYETAYFASGCFWCLEAVYEHVKGVKEVISGYSGGSEKNPNYEQVGRRKSILRSKSNFF